MTQVDEDEEAVVELVEDTETETGIKSLKGDINIIKEIVDKIVKDGKDKAIGLNNLEVSIHRIGEMLNDAIPTLEFAKECIEELGGKENMLYNLRNSLDHKDRGKIYKMRKRAIQLTDLSLIDSSLPDEELKKIKRKKLKAIRPYEVKRLKQLTAQIDDWDDSDFDVPHYSSMRPKRTRTYLVHLRRENNSLKLPLKLTIQLKKSLKKQLRKLKKSGKI